MAKRTPPPVGQPSLDAPTAYEMLTKQLEHGEQIAAKGAADEGAYSTWLAETKHWVEQTFGENSPKANDFEQVGASGYVITEETDFAQIRREGLASQLNLLRAFANVLKQTADRQGGTPARPSNVTASNRVFVVHGHDAGAKETVARFLQKLGLQAVILHEQPSAGRTIIEKFEANADVSFAVVLLTPDDRGGPAAASHDGQSGRARQNVILELGYFLGRLGRERVCALCQEGTEVPSDLHGVVYVPIDSAGAWRFHLAKELKLLFPAVDLNKAM